MVTDIQQATNDESMNDIPQKRCTGPCGRTLPATGEFFYTHYRPARGRVEMQARCKECHNSQKKKKYGDDIDEKVYISAYELSKRLHKGYKTIIKDIQSGKLPAFKRGKALRSPWYIHEEDARRYAEHVATNEQSNGHTNVRTSLNGLAKMAIGSFDECGSCGTTRGNIIADVNDATHEKYGYLCMRCYKLVHDFGEDLSRMRKAIDYVEKTRLKRVAHKKKPATA